MPSDGPHILVVDDDVGIRRLVRTGLELEGFRVIEAATLAQARSVQAERVDGVVLDRQLPDGDGLVAYEELRARWQDAVVVMHSSSFVPAGYPSVPKGDIDGLVEVLGLVGAPAAPPRPTDVARAAADAIVADWIELCRWDPELPADSRPPIAGSIVAAVAAALDRPQPVGWGLDPALEPVAEAYVLNHDAVDVAVGQLVCLREVFERRVVAALVPEQQLEVAGRLTMIVQRLMTVVVRVGIAQLEAQAFTDAVTGLDNVRAFEVDLRRESARATRHDRALTVVRLSVEGADVAIGGDDALAQVGRALEAVAGDEVHAYRLAWADFALLLPDAVPLDGAFVEEPLRAAGVETFAIGMATHPEDPVDRLDDLAAARMRSGRTGPLSWSQRGRHEDGPDH